jgi:tyrosyl-tRNA synthetase
MFMSYQSPKPPAGAISDAEAQLAYLAEDGFVTSPPGEMLKQLRSERPLRVKFGVDPTATDVTWGWSVPLRRLRRFQDLGHTAVLVVGDFTAQIGDPSGRSATRPRLSEKQVDECVEACMASLLEVLSPDNLEVRRNSEWLATMRMPELLTLTSQATVAQLLEREDFRKRFGAQQPISIIEFMYPLLQAYDSVAVRADIELGGVDQLFNLMLGRVVQDRYGVPVQSLLCAPLLVGTDGKKKMSQSVGNYIGVGEEPAQIFGKVMSLPDEALPDYARLATDLRPSDKAELLETLRGMPLKRRIAAEMVAMFHGAEAAAAAEAEFDLVHVRRDLPSRMDEHDTAERYLPRLLVTIGFASSLNDARRSIKGRGVRVDGTVVEDEHATLVEGTFVVQVGRRRFARVTVRPDATGTP